MRGSTTGIRFCAPVLMRKNGPLALGFADSIPEQKYWRFSEVIDSTYGNDFRKI